MRVGIGDIVCDESGCYDDGSTSSGNTPTFTPSNLCVTSDCLMSGTPLTPAQLASMGVGSGLPANTSGAITPASGSSSSSSNPITALLASLTSAASGAVKAATTPAPYYITGPNGQSVLYNPATGTVGQSALSSLGGTSGCSSLMLLALAAVAIFALEKR